MQIQINNTTVDIVKGDIADQDTEALVNAANNHLWMGSGVAGALKKKGGETIEQEAIDQGPIAVGEAVITSAGDLNAQYVIHAASMGQDMQTNVDYIAKATRAALDLVEKRGIKSVSFPAIGTGVGGVEIHQCARTMLIQTIEHLQNTNTLSNVRFVLFDDQAFQAFNDELSHIFEKP